MAEDETAAQHDPMYPGWLRGLTPSQGLTKGTANSKANIVTHTLRATRAIRFVARRGIAPQNIVPCDATALFCIFL